MAITFYPDGQGIQLYPLAVRREVWSGGVFVRNAVSEIETAEEAIPVLLKLIEELQERVTALEQGNNAAQ